MDVGLQDVPEIHRAMFGFAISSPRPDHGDSWAISATAAFDFLSDEYRDLFVRANATIFQSPVWLDRIYATLAPRFDALPLIVTIRAREGGRLVALLPLAVRRFRGVRVATFADFGVADYCAVVVDPHALDGLLDDARLPSRIRSLLRCCDLLSVRKVREQDARAFDLIGGAVRSRAELSAHASTLAPQFETWLDNAMDPTQRRSLERKRRKLRAKGDVRVDIAESGDAIVGALEDLRGFRAQRFKASEVRDLLSDEVFVRFYDELAHRGASARAYTLRVDGAPVSIAFGVARDDTFHMLLSGFSPDYRNYSVGLLVIQDVIQDCVARGESRFDLTIGDQPYKRAFGTVETRIWSVWSGIGLPGRGLAYALSRSQRALRLARRMM